MNKAELIETVALRADISKVNAKKAVDSFIKTIEQSLASGNPVSLTGFGTFAIIEKSERRGVNPRTKQPMTIPARRAVRFRPGDLLSKVVL